MNINEDCGIVDHASIPSDLLVSNFSTSEGSFNNAIEIKEVFFDEQDDLRDAVVQRSVDLKKNSLPFDIHYTTPECSNLNLDTRQKITGDVTEVVDNVNLQHFQTNNALLKLWSVTASEFLLIPCQLEELKPCTIVDDSASSSASASTSLGNSKIRVYNCDICDYRSDKLSSSLLHYEQVHQLSKCPFCVKYFARSCQLKTHLFVHTNRRQFKCTVCKKQFKRRCDLQQHIKRQHTAQVLPTKTFLCDSCGFQSKSENSIRSHVLGHLVMTSFSCDLCNKQCKNEVELMNHRNTHFDIKSYQCEVCDLYFTRREAMIKHRRTQHEGLYFFICDICGRYFQHKTSLTVHLKLHTGENQVECDVCGKKMSGKIALLNHKKMHNQQRDYVCGICGKTYINKYSLQEHLLVHTGSNPFQCLQCDNSFSSRKKLLMHERIHDPQRTLYKCSSCEKSYTSKFKLQEHIQKKHYIIGMECESM